MSIKKSKSKSSNETHKPPRTYYHNVAAKTVKTTNLAAFSKHTNLNKFHRGLRLQNLEFYSSATNTIKRWKVPVERERGIRASTANVIFMLNAIIWHIWHIKHQKQSFIRCVKCVKLLQHWTITLQFATVQTNIAFAFIIFLFDFSLSSHFFNWFFLSPHNLSLSPNRCSFLFKSDSQLLPQP